MTKKLVKHGNSAALIPDKPTLDLLNLTMDTPLEISTDRRSIVISPSAPGSQDQITRYGGDLGIRDLGLLSPAIAVPQAIFGGQALCEDVFEIAAACAFHIFQIHPFLDGNRRAALASALVFLDLNGVSVSDPEDRLYPLMMRVAKGEPHKTDITRTFRDLRPKQTVHRAPGTSRRKRSNSA